MKCQHIFCEKIRKKKYVCFESEQLSFKLQNLSNVPAQGKASPLFSEVNYQKKKKKKKKKNHKNSKILKASIKKLFHLITIQVSHAPHSPYNSALYVVKRENQAGSEIKRKSP